MTSDFSPEFCWGGEFSFWTAPTTPRRALGKCQLIPSHHILHPWKGLTQPLFFRAFEIFRGEESRNSIALQWVNFSSLRLLLVKVESMAHTTCWFSLLTHFWRIVSKLLSLEVSLFTSSVFSMLDLISLLSNYCHYTNKEQKGLRNQGIFYLPLSL